MIFILNMIKIRAILYQLCLLQLNIWASFKRANKEWSIKSNQINYNLMEMSRKKLTCSEGGRVILKRRKKTEIDMSRRDMTTGHLSELPRQEFQTTHAVPYCRSDGTYL